jgi:hypothetical protein
VSARPQPSARPATAGAVGRPATSLGSRPASRVDSRLPALKGGKTSGQTPREIVIDEQSSEEEVRRVAPIRAGVTESPRPTFRVGQRVECRYKGRSKFYEGTVRRAHGDEHYDVEYDDGLFEVRVPEPLIRALPGSDSPRAGRATPKDAALVGSPPPRQGAATPTVSES